MSYCFVMQMNLSWISYVKHTEVHTAGTLVPERSAFDFKMAAGSSKWCQSAGADHIASELNQAQDEILISDI